MKNKLHLYYLFSYALIGFMGISFGGSIVCFIVFLIYSQDATIGNRLLFLNIISYVLLLLFITLLIFFSIVLWKIRVLKIENNLLGSDDYEAKK